MLKRLAIKYLKKKGFVTFKKEDVNDLSKRHLEKTLELFKLAKFDNYQCENLLAEIDSIVGTFVAFKGL